MDKLKREEEELEAKKAMSKPLQPMSRKKRASSDEGSDEEEQKHEKKKRTPKKKPEEKKAEKVDRAPPRLYKPQNQQEWDRWNAFLGYSENEWRYSIQHGTEALERLVARGANHLIPEIMPGDHTPWIEPPALVPIVIPVTAPHVAQEAAVESLPPLPASPVSEPESGMDKALSGLNLH